MPGKDPLFKKEYEIIKTCRSDNKKKKLFIAVFLGSILLLSAALYFTPKAKYYFFGSETLRPSASELIGGELGGNIFADVPGDHPNAYALAYLKSQKIIKGYEDGTFKPDDLIKRGEVIKLIVGTFHVYPHHVRYSYCFPDVADEWFAPYVCYANDKEWVSGGGDENFYPERNVKGAEVLKIFMKAYGVGVREINEGEPWYNPYVEVGRERGWTKELMEYGFDPEAEMTRSQVAEMLFRIIETENPA